MKRPLILIPVTLLLAMSVAGAHAEFPKQRIAVLSGRVTDVDDHDITIIQDGSPIRVEPESELRGDGRDLRDYFIEGMVVTVEGVRRDNDEIIASRITPGPYYDTLDY